MVLFVQLNKKLYAWVAQGWRPGVQAREYRQNARGTYIEDVLEAFRRRHIIIIGHYAVEPDASMG